MPRKARIDAPGTLHHIIVRGIERKRLFQDNIDNDNFLERVDLVLTETSTPCYAWALMKNHAHFLLKTGMVPIATIMRRLLTGYAQQFNRRHDRHGPLFQNRYKSILCQEDAYLRELVRYIHLNPLRAEIVKDMDALKLYPYCGHGALMGEVPHSFQDTDYILNFFGHNIEPARRSYLLFVRKGMSDGRKPELVGGGLLRSVGGWTSLKKLRSPQTRIKGDERILGGSKFVTDVMKKAKENYDERTHLQVNGPDLDTLAERAAEFFKIDLFDLKRPVKDRYIARARSIVCYLAVRVLMLKNVEVARYLSISPSAVSKAARRGRVEKLLPKAQKELLKSDGPGAK